MSFAKTKKKKNHNYIENYVTVIPKDLQEILVPDDSKELSTFSAAIQELKIKEVEREYVMEIQHAFNIPIRPNESVKATMIRARLKILKERLKYSNDYNQKSIFKNLPVDPLE